MSKYHFTKTDFGIVARDTETGDVLTSDGGKYWYKDNVFIDSAASESVRKALRDHMLTLANAQQEPEKPSPSSARVM